MCKTKYRIIKTWKTKTDIITGEVKQTSEPLYKVEYRNLLTILFGSTWNNLFRFTYYRSEDEAVKALTKYLDSKKIKEQEHKVIVWTSD